MLDFPSFILRKNHTQYTPNRIIYLDTETTQDEQGAEQFHKFKIGWTCYTQTRYDRNKNTEVWEFWDNPEYLCMYIDNKAKQKTSLTIIGHNVFYDLQVSEFFKYLTAWGWKLRFTYNKGLVYILVIAKDRAVIRCISTTNFFPVPLKTLGKMIGLEKLEVDFKTVDDDTLSTYCKRDVEIVKVAMERYFSFLLHNDMGRFCVTRASQSFAAFRHRFMNHKIYIHRVEEMSEFERQAYYGGRVECFRIGEQKEPPYLSLDVNSLYPFVMRSFKYPTRIVDYQKNPDLEMVRLSLSNRCVVAEVVLTTDEPAYAYRKNNKVCFPVGTFKTFVCTEGLRYAFNHGHVKDVLRIAYYEKASIFQEFVNYFYEIRNEYKKQGNREYEQFCKYLLISLYGKFGQKQTLDEVWDDITYDGYYREEILDAVTGKKEILTKLFNVCVSQWGEKTAKNAFVAIAAHVTEYGRFTLWKIINSIGTDKVLYSDTDSVFIRKDDLRYVDYPLSDTQLGALKIEKTYNKLTLHGCKDYETDLNTKRKGVPGKCETISDNVFKYTQWCKQDTHLRRRLNDRFLTRTIIKTLARTYDKGVVNKDGTIKPFNLTFY